MTHNPKTHVLVRKPGTGVNEPFALHKTTWENMSAVDRKEFELITDNPPEVDTVVKKDMASVRESLAKINPETQSSTEPIIADELIANSESNEEEKEEEVEEKVKSKPGKKKK